MTYILQGCADPVICYSFYTPTSDALLSNDFEDLFLLWMKKCQSTTEVWILPSHIKCLSKSERTSATCNTQKNYIKLIREDGGWSRREGADRKEKQNDEGQRLCMCSILPSSDDDNWCADIVINSSGDSRVRFIMFDDLCQIKKREC